MSAKPESKLNEQRSSHPPLWTNTRGVYADLSGYPKTVDYYVKCPKCSHVHGGYQNLRQALEHRNCPACHFDQIEQIKKDVAKSLQPEKKTSRIREAIENGEDPLQDINDFKDELEATASPGRNWILDALIYANQHISDSIELADPDDKDEFDSLDKVEMTDGNVTWYVYKDESVAEAEAVERIKTDLEDDPDTFAGDWCQPFINKDKLADHIGDPYEDWEEDQYGSMDYTERLEALVDGDVVEGDDDRLFGYTREDPETGETVVLDPYDDDTDADDVTFGPLPETPERVALVNELISELAENTKPTVDPEEWMKDIYGNEWFKHVIEAGCLDAQAAAEYAVNSDGWAHTLNHYDGNSYDFGGNAVGYRD